MKTSNNAIRNRTRDLPASITVLLPTACPTLYVINTSFIISAPHFFRPADPAI